MNDIEIEKSEWHEWKALKVTKQMMADLLNMRDFLKEGIVEGHLSNEEERLISIGRCQGIKESVMYMIDTFNYIERTEEEKEKET